MAPREKGGVSIRRSPRKHSNVDVDNQEDEVCNDAVIQTDKKVYFAAKWKAKRQAGKDNKFSKQVGAVLKDKTTPMDVWDFPRDKLPSVGRKVRDNHYLAAMKEVVGG